MPRIVFILLLLLLPHAHAHRLNVFAYPEGDEIKMESYFSRGGACMNCPVEALDAAGNVVASGTTDEQGRWSFRPNGREATTLAVLAGEGHRGDYKLQREDYPDAESEPPQPGAEKENAEPDQPAPPTAPLQTHGVTALSASEVETIVDRVLERKLGPLRREFNKAQIDEPGLQEIVGGIGYIFGLFGVAAYFLSRSNRKS